MVDLLYVVGSPTSDEWIFQTHRHVNWGSVIIGMLSLKGREDTKNPILWLTSHVNGLPATDIDEYIEGWIEIFDGDKRIYLLDVSFIVG